jgi:hypothetical protein
MARKHVYNVTVQLLHIYYYPTSPLIYAGTTFFNLFPVPVFPCFINTVASIPPVRLQGYEAKGHNCQTETKPLCMDP